jgi:hypothetical protein
MLCLCAELILFGICSSIYFRKYVLDRSDDSYFAPFTICITVFRTLLFLVEVYVGILFGKYFMYFASRKIFTIERIKGYITIFNKIILVWAIGLYALYMLTIVLKTIFAPATM